MKNPKKSMKKTHIPKKRVLKIYLAAERTQTKGERKRDRERRKRNTNGRRRNCVLLTLRAESKVWITLSH